MLEVPDASVNSTRWLGLCEMSIHNGSLAATYRVFPAVAQSWICGVGLDPCVAPRSAAHGIHGKSQEYSGDAQDLQGSAETPTQHLGDGGASQQCLVSTPVVLSLVVVCSGLVALGAPQFLMLGSECGEACAARTAPLPAPFSTSPRDGSKTTIDWMTLSSHVPVLSLFLSFATSGAHPTSSLGRRLCTGRRREGQ